MPNGDETEPRPGYLLPSDSNHRAGVVAVVGIESPPREMLTAISTCAE